MQLRLGKILVFNIACNYDHINPLVLAEVQRFGNGESLVNLVAGQHQLLGEFRGSAGGQINERCHEEHDRTKYPALKVLSGEHFYRQPLGTAISCVYSDLAS